jgi:hypothetical protein
VLLMNNSRVPEPEVVIKEVYVDVIKEVQVLVEVPVVREVHIEVPVEVIREVIFEVPVLAPPTATSAGGDSSAVTAVSETATGETVSAVTAEDRSAAEALQQATFTGACTLGANMLSKRDYSSAALAYKLGEFGELSTAFYFYRFIAVAAGRCVALGACGTTFYYARTTLI